MKEKQIRTCNCIYLTTFAMSAIVNFVCIKLMKILEDEVELLISVQCYGNTAILVENFTSN